MQDPAPKIPAWLAELPPEIRRRVQAGDFENVPEKYRELIRQYQKRLAEIASPPAR